MTSRVRVRDILRDNVASLRRLAWPKHPPMRNRVSGICPVTRVRRIPVPKPMPMRQPRRGAGLAKHIIHEQIALVRIDRVILLRGAVGPSLRASILKRHRSDFRSYLSIRRHQASLQRELYGKPTHRSAYPQTTPPKTRPTRARVQTSAAAKLPRPRIAPQYRATPARHAISPANPTNTNRAKNTVQTTSAPLYPAPTNTPRPSPNRRSSWSSNPQASPHRAANNRPAPAGANTRSRSANTAARRV